MIRRHMSTHFITFIPFYCSTLINSNSADTSMSMSSSATTMVLPEDNDTGASSNKALKPKSKTQRCQAVGCNKKVWSVSALAPCRCGGAFCRLHRLPDSHACGVDYRTVGKVDGVGGGVFQKVERLE